MYVLAVCGVYVAEYNKYIHSTESTEMRDQCRVQSCRMYIVSCNMYVSKYRTSPPIPKI